MEHAHSFGYWLRRRRKALDLTQAALADRAGCTPGMIKRLEAEERRPSRELAARLATVLAIPDAERAAFLQLARGHGAAADLAAAEAPVLAPDVARSLATPPQAHTARLPPAIPVPLTPLLGRATEVAKVAALLSQESVRLLTLTGPGGVGKTRLALAVIEQAKGQFADGARFVDLAPVHDPTQVLPTIARALGLREDLQFGQPDQLATALSGSKLLLVLDNLEQVLQSAPLLAALLERSPGLKLLVTSRAALGLRGEHEVVVPPLPVPPVERPLDVAAIAEYAAVQLFVERAQAVRTAFRVTAENAPLIAAICARLDGLPLALELAAARVRVFTPELLLARLDDRLPLLSGGPRDLPARQQTIANTIDWSYQLLEADARRLFVRLGVFANGWSLQSAEEVVADEKLSAAAVAPALEQLVASSLVQAQASGAALRFQLLETVRVYALERLWASGEAAALQRRHAEYFLRLAEQAAPELRGERQAWWLTWLEVEHSNLHTALEWAAQQSDGELGARLAGALWRFWYTRGDWQNARERLAQVLSSTTGKPSLPRALALHGAGVLANAQGHRAAAQRYLTESLALLEQLGSLEGQAEALHMLGVVAWGDGDPRRATEYLTTSLGLRRRGNDLRGVGATLNALAEVAWFSNGDAEGAQLFLEESLAMCQATGDQLGIAQGLLGLGELAYVRGALERAQGLLEESLRLFQRLGHEWGIANSELVLGQIARDTGAAERAEKFFAGSLARFQALGDQSGLGRARSLLVELARVRGGSEDA